MSSPAAQATRRLEPEQVAEMLDTLAAADRQVAHVLDRIATSRSPVGRGTVTALERLLTTLRPAADVRDGLAHVDRQVLAVAIRLRREQHDGLRVVGGELQ